MTPDERLAAFYRDDRPLVFAHRGAMAHAPMNTLAAFQLAEQHGADGIELDVWITQDDQIVVIHDFELNHTTNGEGRIGSTTLDTIRQLDAGSWFSDKFAGQKVPTLNDVFETLRDDTLVNIEIKSLQLQNQHVAWHTIECIKAHNRQERVLISSFNPLVLRQVRSIAPELPLGYLESPEIKWRIKMLLIGLRFHAWHPENVQITATNVARAHQRGRKVNTWTVNDPAEARRLRDLGVDMLITDDPALILQALTESPPDA
jgi:glycerophosphoryl diester phosphodiesterase